jgi:uncharacterized protein (TIGR03663 family)
LEPSRHHRLVLVFALFAAVAGACWRWHYIDSRPLHTDEAVQAWQTWQLLRGDGYRYDPVDRHGPWLYYGAATVERLRGGDASTLNDVRVRTFVWLAGVATLALIALIGTRLLPPAAAAIATAILAAAPLAVLYHTYFVQEAWLALFTWALVFSAIAWLQRPRLSLALAVGVCAGLMQVTKETSVLHFAALGIALLGAWGTRVRLAPKLASASSAPAFHTPRATLSHLAAALAVAFVIYLAFYSSFGSHPFGVVDGIKTYVHQWQRSGDVDHTYPSWHYLSLLWPHRAGGVRWGEPALLAFAGGGALLTLRQGVPVGIRVTGLFTIVLLLVYSLIPYKTPWLLLTPVIGLALLAGHGIAALGRIHRRGAVLVIVCTVATVTQLVGRTRLALDRYPGDARNPYFYQQTPRGFTALVSRVQALIERGEGDRPRIAVVSPDYAWPLPWYLRNHHAVGYFTATAPDGMEEAFDLVIWDTRIDSPDTWPPGSVIELHGLRPNVLLQLVIPPEWWNRLFPPATASASASTLTPARSNAGLQPAP